MSSRKDLTAASSQPIVLAILSRGENYGYAIIKEVSARSGGALEWSDGMLYPVLHRLEKNGWIKARWGTGESGRRRKYYRITEKGIRELEAQREQWQVVNRTLSKLWRTIPSST